MQRLRKFFREARTPAPYLAAGVLLVLVLFIAFIMVLPEIQRDDIETKIDIRQTHAQILGGLVGITVLTTGAYLTWRTLQVNREGQITERFTRAIDQLGSDKLEIRLGGIYALERIARDSERDHGPVFEGLTAFIREKARWSEENADNDPLEPETDVQAALTVIGRRSRWFGNGETMSMHLQRTNLSRAFLPQAHLEAAHLERAHLEGALEHLR